MKISNQRAPSRKYWAIGGITLTVLAATFAGYRLWSLTRTGAPAIESSILAELFNTEFSDVNNQSRTLNSFKGKVIVLNFWATWCPPCRQEMPAFSKLQESLGNKGVQIIGIGIDSPSAIKEFALQFPVAYPLFVGGASGMELMRQLGNPTAALPYTFVFHRDGTPAFSHLGMLTEVSLGERINPLLEQKR